MIKILVSIFLVALLLYMAYEAWSFFAKFRASRVLAQSAIPFAQTSSNNKHILVIGDSTAVGVGATMAKDSLAGRLGADFPGYGVEVQAHSGATLKEGVSFLEKAMSDRYELILIQLGANDIVGKTSLLDAQMQLTALLALAKQKSDHVYVLHSGNVGAAGIFPFPINTYYTNRTKKYRAMYMIEAEKGGARYIDLFTDAKNDPFLVAPDTYLAKDQFHPSGEGYALWYKKLRALLVADKMLQ